MVFDPWIGTDNEGEDIVELSCFICLGCFRDGQDVDLNRLTDPDQGIDFFPEQPSVVRDKHVCRGTLMANVWQEKAIRVPLEIYQALTSRPGFDSGPGRIHPDWKRRAEGRADE